MERNIMDNLIFGMHHVNITQLPGCSYSHPNNAVDLAGEDAGVDFWYNRMPDTWWKCIGSFGSRSTGNTRFYIPCDAEGNTKKVRCADLVARTVTLALTHSCRDFLVGRIYAPEETFYQEGTAGKATGNHIHLEVAEGIQTTKSYDRALGVYRMPNELNPLRTIFVSDDFSTVVQSLGADLQHCASALANGLTIVDGTCRLYKDGQMVLDTGEHMIGSHWYYVKENGEAARHEEILLSDGRWVRYDDQGRMIKGLCLVLDEGEPKAYYYSSITGEMNHDQKTINFDRITGAVKGITLVQ